MRTNLRCAWEWLKISVRELSPLPFSVPRILWTLCSRFMAARVCTASAKAATRAGTFACPHGVAEALTMETLPSANAPKDLGRVIAGHEQSVVAATRMGGKEGDVRYLASASSHQACSLSVAWSSLVSGTAAANKRSSYIPSVHGIVVLVATTLTKTRTPRSGFRHAVWSARCALLSATATRFALTQQSRS